MLDLPKVRKTAAKGMTRREKVKKVLLGVVVGVGVAVAGSLGGQSAQAAISDGATIERLEAGALLFQPPTLEDDTVAQHYSHRSHYSHSSHSSHRSHYSHYSSGY